ncbi:nucleoside triphosphate pyrophosphohydrolase [Agaribacterium haliotis]|uniref:nucleoside triphosphate pyrophosphohydrolase n=1 Tax=Agaribacterium haliotis TaxID=2013869 RepID=UPI0032E4AED0
MAYSIDDLLYLMRRLRKADTGCPWDLKQDFRSITPSTIEEVYEVVDSIEREDWAHLGEELGDLLFQIVFYSQLGAEQQYFDFDQVVNQLTQKLLRRHPHVFPDGSLESERSPGGDEQALHISQRWEQIKAVERAAKGLQATLDDVPKALPALQRAQKLQKRVAKAGMDFSAVSDAITRMRSELDELEAELQQKELKHERVQAELGDILFSAVNVARKLGCDADQSLRCANIKFEQRIEKMESLLPEGSRFADYNEAQLDEFWQRAKAELAVKEH